MTGRVDPRARERPATGSIATFVSSVASIGDPSPNIREIVLEGGLDDFESKGGDQFVYLMVRRPDGRQVPVGHTMAAQLEADPALAPIAAYYTVRAWDEERGRLTIWIVRHGHAGVGRWADSCAIGERVALWGPRRSHRVRPRTSSQLFVVDETGLGAAAALLDELPDGASGHVIAETVDRTHVIDLRAPAGVVVTWVFRGADPPGTGSRLAATVRALDLRHDATTAFVATEARQATQLRRYLRCELGMASHRMSITGYWRRTVADRSAPGS